MIAGDALVRPEHEDAFGMRRGELAAAGRRAGLIQHRRPLRRRLGQVDRIHLVVSAVMPHAMDLGRIGENSIGLVAQHRAVFPAGLPQLVDDRHVFVGGVVAAVVVGLGRQSHAARRAVEIAGDDVPADPAAGQVVERRHAPGEQIGRFVGQIGGDAETDVLRSPPP